MTDNELNKQLKEIAEVYKELKNNPKKFAERRAVYNHVAKVIIQRNKERMNKNDN